MSSWDFVPFPEGLPLDHDPYVPKPITKPTRRASGISARRRKYVRPDESDIEAYAAWASSPAPVSSARIAEELAKWFGAVCALCHEPIDMTLTSHHPARWNVDHIIPVANGGLTTWGNLQLAHRGCNMEKSNLALPEPPPWLYAQFCRAAVGRFENYGSPERNLLERARYEAVEALRNLGIMTTNFEEYLRLGWDVSGFPIEKQKARVEKAIAKVVRLQDRAIARHDAKTKR